MSSKHVRTILAIESSCDETAAAVVKGRDILGECVATQAEMHERFGGVVPEIASRRHLELVDSVIDDALTKAGMSSIKEVDAIAVTQGPGLIGALLVGVAAGVSRSWAAEVPLLTVDHLLGHIASSLLDKEAQIDPPFLCLLVSGGHTLALDVDENMKVTLLGSTRDDAAGEAFDKGARMLGLSMPGGPALSALAENADKDHGVVFTPAMVHQNTLDTSFSGIKTALSMRLNQRALNGEGANDANLADAFQTAIVETLSGCVRKLIKQRGINSGHKDARNKIALVGGVAANVKLRDKVLEICEENGMQSVRTPLRWCGDNAAMIGVAAQWYNERDEQIARQIDAYATSPLFRDGFLMPS